MSGESVDPDAFRAFERDAHDEIADGYRDFFCAVTSYAVEPLLDAASVGAGSRVLDVATGPGVLASRAAGRGAARVVGVDISPGMLAIAAAQYPGVEFRQGDAENLPFDDASFDAVLCNFGVGHFPRPDAASADFVRVAAPGGVVAVSWWDVPARHRLNGIFFDAFTDAGASPPPGLPVGPPMFRFSDETELRGLFDAAGLVGIDVSSRSFVHDVPSAQALWDGILGGTVRTSIGIRRQPPAVRERIRAAFDRLVQPYVDAGRLAMPVAFKIATGRKRST